MNNQQIEAMQTAQEYIPKLKNGIEKAAELFQSMKENEGSILMYQIIDGIKWSMDVLVLCEQLSSDRVETINEKLRQIVEAFENNDFILVGDLLQYEFLPEVENMNEEVNAALSKITLN